MKVRIRLFAVLKELAGEEWVDLELQDGATVAEAMRALSQLQGALREAVERMPLQMAVNRDYARPGTRLHAGDELALIPPLSGGAGETPAAETVGAAGRTRVRIASEPLVLQEISDWVGDPAAGAVAIFQGVTREVERLDYEAYCEMAQERLQQIAEQCAQRHGLRALAIEHRVGGVPLGQPSVIVAASAAHRSEAFAGAREAIDRVKSESPIWKREVEGDEARWVQGTPAPGAIDGVAQRFDGDAQKGRQALTHMDEQGNARMVDVGSKMPTERVARARATLKMSSSTAAAVARGNAPKGEVLGTARLAGIQAAKQTGQLIPLAHPLALTFIDVHAGVDEAAGVIELVAEVRTVGRTGVEMEAMSACAVAALTVYDMVKGLERGVRIEEIVLLEKTGGRSDWRLDEH